VESIEYRIAKAILGQEKASALMVDAYKLAMAQAGFPLREEIFALCFRRGGPFYNPFDLNAIVQFMLPSLPSTKEAGFLTANGYPMTTAMDMALQRPVHVVCPPKGAWIGKGEPVLTNRGASFLVSWLEDKMIMLQYPIQIATAIKKGETEFTVTCQDEADIVLASRDAVAAMLGRDIEIHITMDTEGYLARVKTNIQAVIAALKGDAHRAFEVGLRAATCMQQHLMVLQLCENLGIRKTSNVFGAWKLYMIPVGTTGHEHQMRWGGKNADDRHGYRAIRDMRPEPPSYLFDTTDPMNKGIPAALEVMAEDPDRPCSMRFDSGDQDQQFLLIKEGCDKLGIYPMLPFEDSYNAEKTAKNEAFCDSHGWPREKRLYGYGGFFTSQPALTPYNRDVASAAYKLAMSAGDPKQKFSGSKGKKSITGKPVILEIYGFGGDLIHLIAQEGETVENYHPISCYDFDEPRNIITSLSPMTQAIEDQIQANLG